MAGWSGSSLQIVIAVIGSGLILTGVTSLASLINNPLLNISVDLIDVPHYANFTYQNYDASLNDYVNVTYPHGDNYTTYRILLKNIGNSPAKDVRLTMTYTDAKVVNTKPIYENENTTLRNETSNTVYALFPRLSTKTEVAVENNITANLRNNTNNLTGGFIDPMNDFKDSQFDWAYSHTVPFSIIATYDNGAVKYESTEFSSFGYFMETYFNIEFLEFYLPVLLAILLFGVAFRHKRKSTSGSASKILTDINTVEKHLKNNDSRAIISLRNDDSENHNIRIFENYDDYDLIEEFYKGLEERGSEISKAYLSNDPNYIDHVKEQNKKCFNLAMFAHSKIDWKKFYKFDLILLIPAIVLSSSFVSLVLEAGPLMIFVQQGEELSDEWFYALFFIAAFLARSIGSYFILKWILHKTQGYTLSNYAAPVLCRRIKLFAYCSIIIGAPTYYIIFFTPLANIYDYAGYSPFVSMILVLAIDISRMCLLIMIVSPNPIKGKMKATYLDIIKKGRRKL